MNITIKNLEQFFVCCGFGSLCLTASLLVFPVTLGNVAFGIVAGMFYCSALGCVDVKRIKDGK